MPTGIAVWRCHDCGYEGESEVRIRPKGYCGGSGIKIRLSEGCGHMGCSCNTADVISQRVRTMNCKNCGHLEVAHDSIEYGGCWTILDNNNDCKCRGFEE